ncbi:MAG: RHS repeat domain-containing protein [Bacteroidota bacterium]
MNHRIYFILLLAIGLQVSGLAQEDENEEVAVNLSPQLDMLMRVPQTPEAAAFIQHGNIPVNMYTGTPQISIPLHNIDGREFALPISLTYDASGIKVDQIATWVGLGWNLNAGGAVTRMVQGIPDGTGAQGNFYEGRAKEFIDYVSNNSMSTGTQHPVEKWQDYFDLQRELAVGQVDFQPDLFPFSINGLTGTILINYETGEAICIEHPQLKVEVGLFLGNSNPLFQLQYWKITAEDGTQYIFGKPEITNHSSEVSGVPFFRRYISAWYITEIISANTRDKVEFIYSQDTQWENKQDIIHTLSGVSVVNPETNSSDCGGNSSQPQYLPGPNEANYFAEQAYLEEIRVNGYKRASFNVSSVDRADLKGRKRLIWLDFFNYLGTELIQRIHLDNGPTVTADPGKYFGDVSQGLNGIDEKQVRLKLDGVKFYGNLGFTSEPLQTYQFEYYEPENVPARNSFAADMWGYYNGMVQNTSLVPSYVENGVDLFPQGANRNPSLSHCRVGTLKKITYPTGGETEFSYSLHTLEPQGNPETTIVEEDVMELSGGIDETGENAANFQEDCFGSWGFNVSGNIPLHARASFSVNSNNPTYTPQKLKVSVEGTFSGIYEFMYFILYRSSLCRPENTGDCSSLGLDFCSLNDHAINPEQSDVIDLIVYGDPANLDGNDAFVASNATVTRLPNGSFEIDLSQLEDGGYQILAFNINQGETLKVSLTGEETEEDILGQLVGGLRVVEMIDKLDATTPATHRYFQYRDLSEEGLDFSPIESLSALYPSTGKAMYNPIFTSRQISTGCNNNSDGADVDLITCERISIFSSFVYQGSGLVGYSSVSEIQYDPNTDITNGFTVYGYYNQTSSLEKIPKLYANPLTRLNGRLNFTRIYASDKRMVSESQNSFSITQLDDTNGGAFSNQGILMESSENYSGLRIVTSTGNGNGVLGYYNGCAPLLPEVCVNAPICSSGNFPSDQQVIHYSYASYWIRNEESIQHTYESGFQTTPPVTLRTQYFYENPVHKQVSRITIENSDNTLQETRLYYPDDDLPSVYSADEILEIQKLNSDNLYHINEVVATEQYYNTTERVFLEKRTYETITDRTLLTGISNSNGSNTLEKVAEFKYINNSAYPIELKRPNGPPTIIMYSYREYLPVIQIQGIDLRNDTDGLMDQLPLLSALLNKDDDVAIQADLESIRQTFPEALITTYTYDERLLLKSITGPDGVKVSYSYDPLGRLIQSSDDDNKLLQAIEYNYAQP